MKKLLLLTTLAFGINANAQTITFKKNFGGTNPDGGYSVQQTSDGGYIIAGITQSFGAGNEDVYLIKTNGNGNSLWAKTFGGTYNDRGNSVQQTADGGYIIAGETESFSTGSLDVYLIKTDGNGNSLWTKTYGGTFTDRGLSVQQTADGGYIIAGETESFGAGSMDVYLIRTDGNGNSLWTKTFGGANYDSGNSIQLTGDGGYIITGMTASFGAGLYDVYLIETDVNGNSLWTKTFGGTKSDRGTSVQPTVDGGYIIAAFTISFGAGSYDVYLIKTNANGDSLWTKTFGGTNDDEGYSIQQTADGGYIIAGVTGSFGAGNYDFYSIKTNANGDSLWTKTFGGASDDYGWSVQQTADGGYIIAGWSMSFGAGAADAYLIKTDGNGNTYPTGIQSEIHNQKSAIFISPNPCKGKFSIQGTSYDGQRTSATIYNVLGEKIYNSIIDLSNNSNIDLLNQPDGIYFVTIKSSDNIYYQKLLKQ